MLRQRMRWAVAAIVGTVVFAGHTAAGGASADLQRDAVRGAAPAPIGTSLSDFRQVSHWAYPLRRAVVHLQPGLMSPVVGHLRLLTEDRLKEVYLLLASTRGTGGLDWVKVGLPGRPNGRSGWVLRNAISDFHLVTSSLVVNRALHQVTLRRAGRVIVTFPVGVGKPSTPTPAGYFWIREKFKVRHPGGIYGPRALGTAAYAPHLTDWPNGGVVGFHGTDEPQLIPGRPSHGCIRLRNRDIKRLYDLVPIGTPVVIL